MLLMVVLMSLVGPLVWDTTLARVASSPLNKPPAWLDSGTWAHPFGTDNSGRDMLALLITGMPASLKIGIIAAGIGMVVGVILGFMAGFMGGWVDVVIRTLADAWLTIPALLVLIVIATYVRQINTGTQALLLSLFAWPGPTRLLRAQALTLRERGYIRMARLIRRFDAGYHVPRDDAEHAAVHGS